MKSPLISEPVVVQELYTLQQIHVRVDAERQSGFYPTSFDNQELQYVPAQTFFLSLSPDMPLKEKRKLLFTTFPNVKKGTIYNWVLRWKPSD